IHDEKPFNEANPHYLRIESEGKPFGAANEGFRGMGLRADEAYNFSAWIRQAGGSPRLRVELYSSQGALLDSITLKDFSDGWKKYSATLHPKETDARAKLCVLLEGQGSLDLD